MKKISISLASAITIIAFIFGLLSGYFISPTYQQTMYTRDTMGLGNADRFVDLRYINQMAAHHKGAILLADQIFEKTQRSEIKSLANDIRKNEPLLIEELYQWKQAWYKDPRKVSDPIVVNLGNMDSKIDLRFLNALIAHHEEGIIMTKEIKTKSSKQEILNNADEVEAFLTNSLITLKRWRSEWYGVK